MNNLITVFTPVYNRGYCIENVYNSLLRQTYKNFEWLVINDGSSDDTDEKIRNFIRRDKFTIRYYSKSNGGQHRALNDAISMAKGYILVIVDSDDDLTSDALDYIQKYAAEVRDNPSFAGVSGLRQYRNTGKIIGTDWPAPGKDYIDATCIERYKKNILLGDKAEAYFVNVLRRYYPIPEFEGENDVEKGLLWNKIGNAGLKVRWFNKAIYNCEYLNDGMSKNIIKNYVKNFNGYCCYIKDFIHYDIGLIRKMKTVIVTCEIARYRGGVQLNTLAEKIGVNPILIRVAYVISYISPVRYKLRNKG